MNTKIRIILAGFIFFTLTAVAGAAVDISNVAVSAIKTDSVKISWDSTVAGTSQIEYGPTLSYGNATSEESLSYFHTTELSGLTEGTLYHFRIRSKEYGGAETVSADYTFTTRTQAELEAVIKAARLDGGLPKTYYVSPTGSDANNGLSILTPFQHPSYAVNKTDAGDTVYLMDGTWTKEQIIFPKSGIDVAPIILTAYNGTPRFIDVTTNPPSGAAIRVNGKAYINIEGPFYIKGNCTGEADMPDQGTGYWNGISVSNSHHINITNVEVDSSVGISIGSFSGSYEIVVDNATVHGGGWNGIMAFCSYTPEWNHYNIPCSNITIQNSEVYDQKYHNAIDIHTDVSNTKILNNRVHDNSGQIGIYLHYKNLSNIEVRNNTVYNHRNGIQVIGTSNSVIADNIIYNSSWYGIVLDSWVPPSQYSFNNTFENNVLYDNGISGVRAGIMVGGDSNDNSFINNTVRNSGANGDYWFWGSNANSTIQNMPNKEIVHFENSPNGTVYVEFTDGRVFTAGSATIRWYPDGSRTTFFGTSGYVTIIPYNMTARPATGSVAITVNKFDLSLPPGNILVDFISDTTDSNNVDFVIGDLKPDTNYQVTRAGVNYHVVKSNANKCIAFSNSEWSAKTFTITETDSIADIITPPGVNIGSSINPIDINQDGAVDISDLRLVALHFGETTTSPYPRYDVDANGTVDILDIRQVAGGM